MRADPEPGAPLASVADHAKLTPGETFVTHELKLVGKPGFFTRFCAERGAPAPPTRTPSRSAGAWRPRSSACDRGLSIALRPLGELRGRLLAGALDEGPDPLARQKKQ